MLGIVSFRLEVGVNRREFSREVYIEVLTPVIGEEICRQRPVAPRAVGGVNIGSNTELLLALVLYAGLAVRYAP